MLKRKVLLIGMATAVCLLAGCGKDAEAVEPETVMGETAVEDSEDEKVAVEETIEEENTITPEEWLDSLELVEPTIVVWNDEAQEGTVLGEGDSYELKEGDRVLLYHELGWSKIGMLPQGAFVNPIEGPNYTELNLAFEGTLDFEITETIQDKNYVHHFTLTAGEDLIADDDKAINNWFDEQELSEPCIVIWNDKIQKGIVLEEYGTGIVGDADRILLYRSSSYTELGGSPGEKFMGIKNGLNYTELQFEIDDRTVCSVIYTINGTEYKNNFILVPQDIIDKILISDAPGEEWASNIDQYLDEPKVLVWNDETNFKAFIEDGEEYHMSEGDVFAKFCPLSCMPGESIVSGGTMHLGEEIMLSRIIEFDIEESAEVDFEYLKDGGSFHIKFTLVK